MLSQALGCWMPVLATAHYYSRYEFEVSQRVPKVIMGRRQRSPPLREAPGVPCGKEEEEGGGDDDDDDGENPARHMPQPGSVTLPLELCAGEVGWVVERES